MKPTNLLTLVASGALLLGTAPPLAAGPIGIAPYVEIGVEHDSNVFRVSDDEEARAISGSSQRSDTFQRGTIGVAAEWPISRQQIVVGASTSEVRYDRFDQLDHSESEVRAALNFQAGPIVYGTVGYQRSRELADFDNRIDNQADFITQQQPLIEAYVEVTPHWRARAQASQLDVEHSLATQRRFDLEQTTTLLEMQYAGAPDSLIGVGLEHIDGEYPGRDGNDPLADAFTQDTAYVRSEWEYSGISHLRGRLGYTRRRADGNNQRDFDGFTGLLGYERTLSAKTRLYFELSQQIFSTEDVDANFVERAGARMEFIWKYSPKLDLIAKLGRFQEDFQAVPGAGGDAQEDTVNEFVAELVYQPYRVLALVFDLGATKVNSNQADERYESLRGGLALRVTLDND